MILKVQGYDFKKVYTFLILPKGLEPDIMNIKDRLSRFSLLLSFMTLCISNRRVYSVIRRVIKNRLTYLELSALIDLYKSVNKIEKEERDGIIIEAGCALGGSALVIASSKERTRAFYIYDVFGMIPLPSQKDGDDAHQRYKTIASGRSKGIGGNTYYGYEENLLERVKQTFCDYGLPPNENAIYLIEGLFENTLFVNEPVALAHIDCDWYESVMICLQRIEPHLVKGGVLIIDDYYTWSGCRKAVDAYFTDKKDEVEFYNKSCLHIIRK